MTRFTLTRKQSRLLYYIEGYMGEHGFAPRFTEMRDGIGVASSSAIFRRLNALEERGHIRRLPNRARAIELLHPVKPIEIKGERFRFIPIGRG